MQRGGRRLILVIGRAPSEAARARAATELAEWGYAKWDSKPFLDKSWIVGAARVQDGAERRVPLAVARPFALTVPKGTKPPVAGRIIYSGPLRAPVRRGTVVAGLEVRIAGQSDHYLPLVATRDIAKAGPFDRLRNGLLGLFE